MADTFEPIQSEEFRRRFGGMKAIRTVLPCGKFGELKFLQKLQVKDSSDEVIYEERIMTK